MICHKGPNIVCLNCDAKSLFTKRKIRSLYFHTSAKFNVKVLFLEEMASVQSAGLNSRFINYLFLKVFLFVSKNFLFRRLPERIFRNDFKEFLITFAITKKMLGLY